MGAIAKLCGVVAALGALNWVALTMAGKDAVTMTIGTQTTTTTAVMAVVGLSAVFWLVHAFKPAKSKKR